MLKKGLASVLVMSLAILAAAPGCIFVPPPPTHPLQGTWALSVTPATDLDTFQMTFDGSGNLTQIVYRVTSSTTLTVANPESAVNVNGSNVVIATTFTGNSLVFAGVIQSTSPATILGVATGTISVGTVVVDLNQDTATMTFVSS